MNESVNIIKNWCLDQVGCPYIFGATKQTCTPEYRQARIAQYPQYKDMITRNCPQLNTTYVKNCQNCKWAINGKGRLAYDCAQLTLNAMKQIGIALVSGANSQWQKTAFVKKGEISEMPYSLLCLLYREDDDKKKHHTGIYLGDGTIVHAKGHDYGVVHEKFGESKFTHYGIPAGLYSNEELQQVGILDPELNLPTLRRSSKGIYVEWLQSYLNKTIGAKLSIDGVFGAETEKAVKQFQEKKKLTVDGVVGPKTWDSFDKKPEQQASIPADSSSPTSELVSVPRELLISIIDKLKSYV